MPRPTDDAGQATHASGGVGTEEAASNPDLRSLDIGTEVAGGSIEAEDGGYVVKDEMGRYETPSTRQQSGLAHKKYAAVRTYGAGSA